MRCALLVAWLAACGGAAERPLALPLGLTRAEADRALAAQHYCHRVDGPRPDVETYPRCEGPGLAWGDSWVIATYHRDRLVELRRYERFSDDAHAVERWNALVGERARRGPASAAAARRLFARRTEPGLRSVQAFELEGGTLVGVYLLRPTPPEAAQILELVVR